MEPKSRWSSWKASWQAFSKATEGQDLVEYAMLTGFMVVAVWAVFPTSIFPSMSTIFSRLLSTAVVLTGS